MRPDVRGASVLSLDATGYGSRPEAAHTDELPVPIVGGGSRRLDIVPWDLAQLPYADTSAAIASVVARHLGERHVSLYTAPTGRLPLRPLVGANMPAVMVEMGFLTNASDESALASAVVSGAIIDAITDTIAEVRRGLPASGRGATP